MGIINKIKNIFKKNEIIIDDPVLRALFSKEEMTKDKVMSIPAVSSNVDFISGIIASMPIKLYRKKNEQVEEVTNDIRTRLLNSDTGDTLDGFQFKKAIVEDYLLDKGGYAYIRKKGNKIIGLHYVEAHNIQVLINSDPIFKFVKFSINGKLYKNYELIKVLRNSKDGASGKSLISELSKVFETSYETLLYQLGVSKSGGHKKGFLKSNHKLSQEELDNLKETWKTLYSNTEDKVAVLNNGLEFQESSNSSMEMQLYQMKQDLRNEINNIFHIKNDFFDTFKECINPILVAITTALNSVMLLENEKGKYFFAFDGKEIIKSSLKDRFEAYKTAKDTGWITINEIRELENYDNIKGLDVIPMSLGSVLYDIKTQTYYTPNTGEVKSNNDQQEKAEEEDSNLDDEIKEDENGEEKDEERRKEESE